MDKIVRVKVSKFLYSFQSFQPNKIGDITYAIENKALCKEKDYQELKVLYDTYLEDIAIVLKKYGFKNEYEVVKMCYYLIECGLFSKDNIFIEKLYSQKYYFLPLLGIKIISGYGDCKNCSYFVSNFSSHFSYETPPLNGKCIERNQNENALQDYHSLTILKINGKKMLYDLGGCYLFSHSDSNQAQSINGNLSFIPNHIFNGKSSKQLLSLPNVTNEELKIFDYEFYQKLADEETRQAFYKDIFNVYLSSKDNLKRISEIEESYSLPKENSKKNNRI